MLHLYDDLQVQPDISKLITSKGLVFAYYICPQRATRLQVYASENYFLYAISGRKIFHSAGKSFELLPGMSVFVRKGCYVMERFVDDFRVMEMIFPEHYIHEVIQEIRIQLPAPSKESPPLDLVTEFETNPSLKACYDSLLPYFSQSPEPSDYLLELKFKEVLLNVLLNPKNSKILAYINDSTEHHRPALQEVMENNYMYNLSLDDFARISCRSLASFKREFNELFNISPGKWIIHKKLEYSKILLSNTKKSIGDIAFESGFENDSHFSRAFKDRFQYSPLLYRKNIM
jgi:AraC-like DNA-binding protein